MSIPLRMVNLCASLKIPSRAMADSSWGFCLRRHRRTSTDQSSFSRNTAGVIAAFQSGSVVPPSSDRKASQVASEMSLTNW